MLPGRPCAGYLTSRMWRPALLLLLLTLALCLPQAGMPDWSGTEGRRVQIALEMLRSGDWMVPTIGGEPTLAKPPLHYWMVAASAAVFGEGHLALRLPAVVAVWLLAVLGFALQRRQFGVGPAWVLALGVVCSPIVLAKFFTAEIDPPFACATAGSLWLLAFAVAREHRGAALLAGFVGGLAMLLKGPPYFLFAVGAWLVWWRHRRLTLGLHYLGPLLLVPLLYYVPLLLLRADFDELTEVAQTETVGRLFTYRLEHLLDTPLFWVRAALVQLPLLGWCFWEWRSERDARMGASDLMLRMCSGGAVLAVVLLTLFPGRPTRYLLPNVPLFMFAVAPAVAHYATHGSGLGRFARGVVRTLGTAGALALLALPWLPPPLPGWTPALALGAALAPAIVRTPRAFVAMCFWLPALGAWTVLADTAGHVPDGRRGTAVHGRVLREELERMGARPDEIEFWGHVHGGLLLGAGLLPPGHEPAVHQPTARFVLREAVRYPPLPELEGYRERLRLSAHDLVFVVEERTPR